ncbi:hypothetical protein SAMN05216429_106137 [Marinobacter persicus]|uniref:DNA-binding protein n=1 Tax=Marinobacter persicus TaxID=930118 RepID=A0A1I3ULA3_9GAMM|nr:hypothetical protein [Marinobacter persicus]GHD52480.1 hypothetical protein GCM10008110_25330 [Marinobacter persicus]SFJ82616.1 hypothetical protein SAMN05216429_106137 [Marinobacter persicus]
MVDDAITEISKKEDWPPVMEWRAFADWIRVDHSIVHMWLHRAYIPSIRIGKRRMVNLVQLIEDLKGQESDE